MRWARGSRSAQRQKISVQRSSRNTSVSPSRSVRRRWARWSRSSWLAVAQSATSSTRRTPARSSDATSSPASIFLTVSRRHVSRWSIQPMTSYSNRPSSLGATIAVNRSLPTAVIATSCHAVRPPLSVTRRQRSAAATTSWPSANTSASTIMGSFTAALAGNSPPFTIGRMASTTTRDGRRAGRVGVRRGIDQFASSAVLGRWTG